MNPEAPQPTRRRKLLRRLAAVALLGLTLWLLAGWITVRICIAPKPTAIQPRTAISSSPIESVRASSVDGLALHAWLVRADESRCVIALPGYGGSREAAVPIAECYVELGWSVLLPDLRATGESAGDAIGFGYSERLDVEAWLAFLHNAGFESIAAHGQSLGAAALTYSRPASPGFAFVVLESCYDDIRNALWNRLPWLPAPNTLLLPVEWFASSALDVDIDSLRPLDRVSRITAPTLFLAGDADAVVHKEETRALHAASGAAFKSLTWIEGGGHTDLWTAFRAEMRASVQAFVRGL